MGKLVRLELFNFKSYKGHHSLLFGDSYFTSIIGPNGSGKSNSMDAISFVLGIKSSHLRSSHLKDLVYRGRVLKHAIINEDGSATANGGDSTETTSSTQERNDPKSAWVMAVYEDEAGDEQTWKRTINSQGASEYRLNNRVVTAQQYNQALEVENILIKARNFLVFQGDVEAIASQSPKDLTRLIEQISGSIDHKAEYERLKEVQEQALENQNYSLNKRRGINSEIKQYQEQKREADSYARKIEQRDQAVVTHVLWKLFQLQKIMDDSQAEIQRHQEELKEHRRGLTKFDQDLDQAKKEHAKAEREVERSNRTIKAKEREYSEKENSLVPLAEKIHHLRETRTTMSAKIGTIRKQRDAKADVVKSLQKDVATVEKAEAQWEAEWQQRGQQQGRMLSESDLQDYNRLKEDATSKTSEDQSNADNLSRQHRADRETLQSLKSTVESFEYRQTRLKEDLEKSKEEQKTVRTDSKKTQEEIDTKKKQANSLSSEKRRIVQLRTELEEKLQQVLTKLLDAEDGRQQSHKEAQMKAVIADMKRIFPGVRARIGDLCKPKQKRYSEAMVTVLGRNFDSIVVDDEKTARECMQYLRDQRRGQATFIPLDTIQVKPINANLKGLAKGTRMAIDVIDYEKSLDRAMSYACGNAIVCDDLQIAKYICYEKGIEAKAVTLDGTVIHKGGLMTGGRGKEQTNRRFEDSELDNLRKLAEDLRTQISALPDVRRNAAEEERLNGDLTGLEQRLHDLKDDEQSHRRNIESKQKELSHTERELLETRERRDEREAVVNDLRERLDEVQASIASIEDRIFSAFCKRLKFDNIRQYESSQGSIQQEAAEKRLEFQEHKARLHARINREQQELRELETRHRGLEGRMQSNRSDLEGIEAERESIANETDQISAELDDLKETLEKQQEKASKRAETVTARRREVQKHNKNLEGLLRNINTGKSDLERASIDRYGLLRRCKLEDITVPLAADSKSLDELPIDGLTQGDPDAMDIDGDADAGTQDANVQDYGIDVDFDQLDDDLRERGAEDLEEELQGKITSLDEDLRSMAPNMRALERLEGVESRLKSTEKEFEDARRKAKRAKDDFQDIKEQRLQLFRRAFTHITEQIDPIYKELTRSTATPMGGQAYLDQEDSDEPYLDGIRYHAMPPLKRFRDMEHLSGGEKTIAALALLFAIHSYQPSPFFVLDEVDAALDNANVARIGNYIRQHAGPGMQFIVISLKTSLFQGSEALVGIHRDQAANSSKALTLDVSLLNSLAGPC